MKKKKVNRISRKKKDGKKLTVNMTTKAFKQLKQLIAQASKEEEIAVITRKKGTKMWTTPIPD